jgi:hypothetical protein
LDHAHAGRLHRNRVRNFGPRGDLGHPEGYHLGTACSRRWTCTIDGNPIGFCLIISGKAIVIGLAITEIPYALGLVGDPIARINQMLPFDR